ncbi:MAG TPA: hypothetical protein VFS46_02620 [Nitrososphaera sp.]|nr:hypothetical protein [Nitrososphaera sp.]
MTTVIDPMRLAGLKQATYVMQCLIKGQSKEDITVALGNDEQLVNMWISFLRHNHWIDEGLNGWSITAKGRTWCGKGVDFELKQRSK